MLEEVKTDDILFEGLLWKFSTGRKTISLNNWKQRWFTVKQSGLEWSEKQGTAPLGAIPWSSVKKTHSTVDSTDNSNATDMESFYFALDFLTDGKVCTLLLRTSSIQERGKWLRAMASVGSDIPAI
eukprot:NODE_11951_length_529_cov_70.337438_g11663_i0.p1 GENE.NODE_11951_length_529_cov_70.337438_g11663_i0~~NODE_11951_length_529_cov_70.337438_g11663_i0.p1  ORF type:complete len:126 (+),score=17.10 NODE_11951_length_529_cov_70.337438_g11663_i0:68-445(+)